MPADRKGLIGGRHADTGATSIALPAREAARLGIDYRKDLHAVEAVVLESGIDTAVFGMSFLNRVEMKREGVTMTLIRRF